MEENQTPVEHPGSLNEAVRQAQASATVGETIQPDVAASGQSVVEEASQESDGQISEIADEASSEDQVQEIEDDSEITLLDWQAHEFIHHQKQPLWYLGLFVVVVALLVVGVLMHQWTGLVVLAAMTLAVVVYSNKAPRILNYSLTESGIMIESKFHPYDQFRSFAVFSDIAWHTIDLDPVKRFAPRLSILFEDKDLEAIVEALSDELPRVDRRPDVIERVTRFLRF